MRSRFALAAIAVAAAGAHAETSGSLEVRVEPDRVCMDGRKPAYLNFDLGIVNATGRALRITQVRGLVLDPAGAVIERRILWSQALAERRDKVPDGRETLVFNPFHFASRIDASTVLRYEVDFDDASIGTRSVLVRHLRNGSVEVHVGDVVESGDVVALADNSGSSLGPHTHYELRDGRGVRGVHANPAHFRDIRIVGTGEVAGPEGIVIDTGDVVAQ